MKPYYLAASLICGNPLSIREEIALLVKGDIDYLHFDVMDGVFVPRYGLYPEVLAAIRSITDLPIEVHMMTEEPERYVADFAKAGATFISVHAEACKHLHHTLKVIREHGMKAGVVLNYATPLTVLDYILDDVDMVMLMAINPGIVGHKLIPGTIKKIGDLRQRIDNSAHDILLAIDGGVSPESASNMISAGTNYLVCGTSSIYKSDMPLDVKIGEFRNLIDRALAE
jgi:ribulose-phosphate 3-epimerase